MGRTPVGSGRAHRRGRLSQRNTVPRKLRWYDPVPEVTTTVDCDGAPHRVTWRRGKVLLEAHDLTSERAMLAFGGELCPCMRVLEVWVEQFRMPPELFGQMHKWLGENAYLLPAEFALPRGLAMVVHWERSWRWESWLHTKQADLLAAEMKEKALPALREHVNAWKAKTGARVISGCQVMLAQSNQPASVEGKTDRVAMRTIARLPARWLVDIWPKGIAVVDDAFVTELAEPLSLHDHRVVAVRWEPDGSGTWATVAAPARVHREPGPAGEPWHLTWDAA